MGFLQPLALLALPLALLPLLLSWRGRRRAPPERFSSLHLFDEARRRPAPLRARRHRKVLILRVLALSLLVLAASRPVGPGRGGPGEHRPTSLVVAVDVSASVGQRDAGREAWTSIRAWADSILGLATGDDGVALTAVADGVVGWWSGPPEALRLRLGALEPTARASDWVEVLTELDERIEDGTEAYLLTDGAVGRRLPEARSEAAAEIEGWRVLRVWESPVGPNRTLAAARRVAPGRVSLVARGWGAVGSAVAGRLRETALVDSSAIPLDGGVGAATWQVDDSATFALAGVDRLPADDRLYVAGGTQGTYRVSRLAVAGEPRESGPFFWEAALASSPRAPGVGRARRLDELADRPPELALLPIRVYRSDEVAALAALAEGGTRLLFAPACPEPACVPAGDWLPGSALDAPALSWRLADPDRLTALTGEPGAEAGGGVPGHLLERVPVRGALEPAGGPPPDWTWDLATGEPALWVRGSVGVWLVPLGPPVTRLATTPIFPLVAEAAVAAWDARWRRSGTLAVGDPAPVLDAGATVTGPLHRPDPTTWVVRAGDTPPRLELPGLYRIEAERTIFVAVNGDPAEGDLAPVPGDLWEAAWGSPPTPPASWDRALFPRRRGPELWPWAVLLALAGLIAEARIRRAGGNK